MANQHAKDMPCNLEIMSMFSVAKPQAWAGNEVEAQDSGARARAKRTATYSARKSHQLNGEGGCGTRRKSPWHHERLIANGWRQDDDWCVCRVEQRTARKGQRDVRGTDSGKPKVPEGAMSERIRRARDDEFKHVARANGVSAVDQHSAQTWRLHRCADLVAKGDQRAFWRRAAKPTWYRIEEGVTGHAAWCTRAIRATGDAEAG